MTITKNKQIDRIEVLENGVVRSHVRTAILEDGESLGTLMTRSMIAPGDSYAGEPARVRAICAAVHTPAVIAAYQLAQ